MAYSPVVVNEVLHFVHALVHLPHALLEALIEAVGVEGGAALAQVTVKIGGVAGFVTDIT